MGGGQPGTRVMGRYHLQAAQATRSLWRYVCDSTRHLQTAAAVSIRAHGVMPGGLFLCYRCHGFLKQCAHVSPVPRVDSAHVTRRGGWGIAFALVSVSGNSWARRFGGDRCCCKIISDREAALLPCLCMPVRSPYSKVRRNE